MKKTLLFLLLFCGYNLFAQQYSTFQLSGFNADVIANDIGPSANSTSVAMDNADFVLMSTDFQPTVSDVPPAYALPSSRIIESTATSGLSFLLAPYWDSNSLRLQEQSDFGAFTVSGALPATRLYVLAATGSGTGVLGGTIYFSDNTSQPIIQGTIPDWFYSTALPVAASGFGRVSCVTDLMENPVGNPRLYQFEIAILPENQPKTITSIDFNKVSAEEGVINIFAVTAELLGTCPSASSVVSSNVTFDAATINWSPAVIAPAMGYDYYLATDTNVPLSSQQPTGNVSTTTLNLDQLTTGQHYCLWVRSRCNDFDFGQWVSTCFTPGEASTGYTGGDIPTLYNFNPDASMENTCPGTVTVNIPDGYYISGVATAYDMQTASNGWMSEQRSLLVCTTSGVAESNLTSGAGSQTGTYHYERSGLHIADGLTGSATFELRAWRTYGSSDCNTDYNRVLGNTWTVTVTLSHFLQTKEHTKTGFIVYPNPAENVIYVSGETEMSNLQLFNLLGQEVLQVVPNGKESSLNIGSLSAGKYLMKITSAEGATTKGIIKK